MVRKSAYSDRSPTVNRETSYDEDDDVILYRDSSTGLKYLYPRSCLTRSKKGIDDRTLSTCR